jgi:hypothetical protein
MEHEIKTSFQHNLTKFHQNFQQQLNSHHNSMIMNIHGMNHQQQHLITTTISIDHEFIDNLTLTISYFTNFEQNTKYTHIYISSMQIHHQQLNFHQIHILKHCIKIKARISPIKFTIITFHN